MLASSRGIGSRSTEAMSNPPRQHIPLASSHRPRQGKHWQRICERSHIISTIAWLMELVKATRGLYVGMLHEAALFSRSSHQRQSTITWEHRLMFLTVDRTVARELLWPLAPFASRYGRGCSRPLARSHATLWYSSGWGHWFSLTGTL